MWHTWGKRVGIAMDHDVAVGLGVVAGERETVETGQVANKLSLLLTHRREAVLLALCIGDERVELMLDGSHKGEVRLGIGHKCVGEAGTRLAIC